MNVLRWDSVAEYLALVEREASAMDRASRAHDGQWRDGVRDAREGRADLAKHIETALAVSATTSERDAHEWHDDRYIGASVSVGRFAQGMPGCVRRREMRARDYRHVGIYVSLATSYDVTAKQRAQRGATLLALLTRLQSEGVSVDLFLYSESGQCERAGDANGDAAIVIRVEETKPLDVTRVAGILCSRDFGFGTVFTSKQVLLGTPAHGPWPSFHELASIIIEESAHVRAALGCAPHDLIVPRMLSSDRYLDHPREWIEAMAHQALK